MGASLCERARARGLNDERHHRAAQEHLMITGKLRVSNKPIESYTT